MAASSSNSVGIQQQGSTPILTERESVSAWYRPANCSAERDIAREAYNEAVEYMRTELKGDEKALKLLEENTSLEEVRRIVEKAENRYSRVGNKQRCVIWLRKLSARIMHYGKVLDMLSQHHPEYTALAWGAVKLVLTGILNHARLVAHFSQALAEIGSALREAKLSAELYQTDTMKEAVSRLYAHIILFFQQAIRWYNMSGLGRALSSVINPFELEYKDTIEQIKLCAETVNDIASAAGRAEIRDIHVTLQLQYRQLQDRDQKLHEMQEELKEMQRRFDSQIKQLLLVGTNHKTISERIDLNVQDMRPRIYDLQFSSIINALRPRRCPQETLRKVLSISCRGRILGIESRESADLLQSLEDWISKEGSSLFFVKVGPRAEAKAKEFAGDVIELLQKTEFGVFWNLSQPSSRDYIPSVTEVLKGLIFQALTNNPNLMHNHPDQFNITRFQTDHTEAEWASLFSMVFSKLSKCFVVVETEELFQQNRQNAEWAKRFLQIFERLVEQAEATNSSLKVLVLSYGPEVPVPELGYNNRIVSVVQKPSPVPPRLRRQTGRLRKNPRWQNLRPRF